jgi:hypothetical protein
MSRRKDNKASKSASAPGASLDSCDRSHEDQVWADSRKGAIAGRGFHYQDVIGAWLCAKVLVSDLAVDRIVPEGFEDLSCEASNPLQVQVQVKSRQEYVGDFSVARVADFVKKMLDTRAKRAASSERLVLILERPVAGVQTGAWGQSLTDLPADNVLRTALTTLLGGGRSANDALASVGVFVLSWHEAVEQAADMVLTRLDLPRASAVPVVSALRDAVAGCVDINAATQFTSRSGLTRTDIERIVTEIGGLVDVAALEGALTSGACEAADFSTPLRTEQFYEGVDVQPGHIVAGLPAPRPAVTGTVVAAIEENSIALVHGPSGVGKSTVMWAAAYVTRHVLWYRVRRLNDADVEPLARLVLAARPTARTPVGLVVDAVGQSGTGAWDALVLRLSGIAGIKLLGSVRNEELLPLRTLPRGVLIPVGLDEEVAERIYYGLQQQSATTLPHWRDAYDKADGLTLEYTHLLTRGRRLSEVVNDQIRARTHGDRWAELTIIAAVSTAHQWGAPISLSAVRKITELGGGQFRSALARLADEHLIYQQGAVLTGLHQLRSGALSSAVHSQPPPALVDTVRSLLPELDDAALTPFIIGALSAYTDLDDTVIDHLVDRLTATTSPTAWTQALHALRIVDFTRTTKSWAEIAQRHVTPALFQPLIMLVVAGTEPLPDTRPEILAALAEIATLPVRASPLRERVLARLTATATADAIAACATREEAVQILAALVDTLAVEWAAVARSLVGSQTLSHALQAMPIRDRAEVLATARTTSPAVAIALRDAAGGNDRLIHDLYRATPWLIDLEQQSDQDGLVVASARLLYAGDMFDHEIDKTVAALGELLAFCFVDAQIVEVSAINPGGSPAQLMENFPLVRRFASDRPLTPAAKSWNRTAMQIATLAAGASDVTLRVQQVYDLLPDLRSYLDRVTRLFLTGEPVPEFVAQHSRLAERADNLTIALSDDEIVLAPGQSTPPQTDDVQALVSGVIHNLTSRLAALPSAPNSLAAFVGDQLRRWVANIRTTERWYLIGVDAPEDLNKIDAMLVDLHAVLAEWAWGNGPHKAMALHRRPRKNRDPLPRIAVAARRTANQRALTHKQRFQREMKTEGVQVSLLTLTPEAPEVYEWPPTRTAVIIDVHSIVDWIHACEVITRLLQDGADVDHLGLQPLVVARKGDRTIMPTLRRISSTSRRLMPHPGDLEPGWREALGETLNAHFVDLVIRMIKSLYAISALRTLHACRPEGHADETAIQTHVEAVRGLYAELELFPEDPVIGAILAEIRTMIAEVQSELDEASASLADQTFAAEFRNPESEVCGIVSQVELLALAWSLSPTDAAEWLSTAHSG